jgi:hypothetical protein
MRSSVAPAPPIWARLLALAATLALLLCSLACGRKGDPRPRSELSSEVGRPVGTQASTGS